GRVPPTMTAVRVSHPPTLDGRLDDPAWAGAVPIRGFTETDPDEGKAASESTTVMLLYDADAIYVGARLYDDAPAKISSRLGRRDDNTQSDVFYVDFDSYHDHRTVFEFAVNPAGVKLDDLCSNDFFIGDRSWDPCGRWRPRSTRSAGSWRCGSRSRSCGSPRCASRCGASTFFAGCSARTSSPNGYSRRRPRRGTHRASATWSACAT